MSSRSPLPPNRTGGSPASGSPVGGSPPRGLTGRDMGRCQGIQPMRRKEHALLGRRQHALRPDRPFGPRPSGQDLSVASSRHRHWRRSSFGQSVRHASTFLHPFARRALPRVFAPMGALTPVRSALRPPRGMNTALSPDRSPCFTSRAFAAIPPPLTRRSTVVAFARDPSERRLPRVFAGPRLHHWLAGSPVPSGRIEFVILRTGRSPSDALHLLSRERSFRRLQAGARLPEGDFHPSDPRSLTGALAQRFIAGDACPASRGSPVGTAESGVRWASPGAGLQSSLRDYIPRIGHDPQHRGAGLVRL